MENGAQTALLHIEPVEQPGEGASPEAPSPVPPSFKVWPRRRDGFYRYNGKKYVSVTEVLGVLNKEGLTRWAATTAASLVLADPERYSTSEKAATGIYEARDKAADRGSTIHSLIEAFAKGGDVQIIPEAFQGFANAFWSWVATVQPIPLYSEANVFSDAFGYAGTLDLVAAFPDKQVRLLDVKTTKRIYDEAALQMAAYRAADFILPRGEDAEPIPMLPVAETAVLLLREDGTFEYRTLVADLEVFLAAKKLWHWKTGK